MVRALRRSQTDSGSQPVRNLATSPTFTTTAGTAIVRTNQAPCPRMTSTYLGLYGGGTLSTVTGISDHPDGITTAVRVTHSTSANSGALVAGVLDVSTQYTMSLWIYNEGSVAQSFGIAVKSIASNGGAVVQPGVWTKLTWVGYTTPGALSAGNELGVRIPSPSQAGTFLVTGVLVEKGNVVLNFFDGATIAGGDFTYSWTGTANSSSSRQSGVGVASVNGTGSSARALYQSSDRPCISGKFARLWVFNDLATGMNPTDTVIADNVQRTDLLWLRANRTLSLSLRYRTPDGVGIGGGPTVNLVKDVWQLVRVFDKKNVGANAALGVITSTGTLQPGDMIDIGPHMVVEGTYTGDFIDGTKPLSKWDGTPNASTSVGYPQQFLDLAGAPSLQQIGIGSSANPVVDGFAARTIYVVYEVVDTNASWQVPFSYGWGAPTDGLTFQTAAAGSLNLSPRLDFATGGGDINRGSTLANGRTVRRHVAAFAANSGITSANYSINGVNVGPVGINPGTIGWTSGQLRNVSQPTINALHSMVYYAEHDAATRLAVSRYLGNKYGAAVA